MTYPYEYPTDMTGGIPALLHYCNLVTGGAFGIVILVLVWIVSFAAVGKFPKQHAVAFACFLTAISSFLLSAISVVDGNAVVICTVLLIASTGLLFVRT